MDGVRCPFQKAENCKAKSCDRHHFRWRERALLHIRKITAHPPSGTSTNILEFTDGSPLPGIKRHGADLAPCLLLVLGGHGLPSPKNVRSGGNAVASGPKRHSTKRRTEQLTVRWVADAVPRRLLNAFVRPYVSLAPFVASSPASIRSPAWVEKEAQGLCF